MKPHPLQRLGLACIAACGCLLLAACASQSGAPAGQNAATTVEAATPAALAAIRARQADLENRILDQPLTPESAAELAVLHHPTVTRALGELALPEAQRLELAYSLNRSSVAQPRRPSDPRVERALSTQVLSWLNALAQASPGPAASRAADEAGAAMFAARRAWIEAVAAAESLGYRMRVHDAALAGRDVAERMRRVGSMNALDATQAQRFHAQAVAALAQSQADAAIAREQLAAAAGLWGAEAERMRMPAQLPEVPGTAIDPEGLEGIAVASRLDVLLARRDGGARLDELALNARAETRSAWLAYRAAHAQARHAQDALLPLAERVSKENSLRYNGMLLGFSDLVGDAVEQVRLAEIALEARRRFWLAELELQRALAGVGRPVSRSPGAAAASATGIVVPGHVD